MTIAYRRLYHRNYKQGLREEGLCVNCQRESKTWYCRECFSRLRPNKAEKMRRIRQKMNSLGPLAEPLRSTKERF